LLQLRHPCCADGRVALGLHCRSNPTVRCGIKRRTDEALLLRLSAASPKYDLCLRPPCADRTRHLDRWELRLVSAKPPLNLARRGTTVPRNVCRGMVCQRRWRDPCRRGRSLRSLVALTSPDDAWWESHPRVHLLRFSA